MTIENRTMDNEKNKSELTPEAFVGIIILGAMAWGCCMSVAILAGVLK